MNTLSFALLGTLASRPRTGWELSQHMNVPMAFMWTAQHSQIYPELKRLAGAGLIRGTVIKGRGPRDTKRYAITPSGRHALSQWADSPLDPEMPRSELMLRVRSLWLTSPERARAFISVQRQRVTEELDVLDQQKAGFAPDDVASPDHPEFFAYATLQYGLHRTRAAIAWCDWLIDQLDLHQGSTLASALPTDGTPTPE